MTIQVKQVNVRLDESMANGLQSIADRDGTTVTTLVRTAILRTYPEIRDN